MESAVTTPSRQNRTIVWLTLLLLAAIAWVVIFQQTQMIASVNEGMAAMEAGPVSLLLFLPVWVTMMVAMMFPAVAPVVSLFATISTKRRAAHQPAAPTWLFLIGYLFVWSLFGIGAYLLSVVVPAIGMMAAGLRMVTRWQQASY